MAIVLEEISKTGEWIRGNPKEAAAKLAPIEGLDPETIEAGLRHYQHIYKPIDEGVLNDQQKIADTFYDLKLIPKKISVRDALVSPGH